MSYSLIKILSISIFVAKNLNHNILVTLLEDHTKSKVNKKQYIIVLMLVKSYEKKNILETKPIYKIINNYIKHFGDKLCQYLLYN